MGDDMAKDLQTKMQQAFEEELKGKEQLEYLVYGSVAPTAKKMIFSFIATIVLIAVLIFIPINSWIKLMIFIIYVALVVRMYLSGVYIGKFGKRMYVYELNYFGKRKDCNDVLLKFVNLDGDRSNLDSHVMLVFKIDEDLKYIMVKKEGSRLPVSQSVNFMRLVSDISKRHR